MQLPNAEITFVHLAYLDDSDTKAKPIKWQVMSGVILEDKNFKLTEAGMYSVQQALVPPEKWDSFEEFHACELYGGHGVFSGIDQTVRFEAIRRLLTLIEVCSISVVYGAVDMGRLQREVYASADPLDISFRICAKGIQAWLSKTITGPTEDAIVERWMEELVILIVDECDKKVRDSLQRSFRSLRPPRMHRDQSPTRLFHFHDDMYFGDSRYSLGIQLADLCSYFIARHLAGDSEIDSFYDMIRPHVVYSDTYPPHETTIPAGAPILASLKSLAALGAGKVDNEESEEKTSGE